jgi:hypothetical protein
MGEAEDFSNPICIMKNIPRRSEKVTQTIEKVEWDQNDLNFRSETIMNIRVIPENF